MNRTAFVMSALLVGLGVLIAAVGTLIEQVLPKAAYALFQASTVGSYDPAAYVLNFTCLYGIAGACVLLGIIGCIAFYRRGIRQEGWLAPGVDR